MNKKFVRAIVKDDFNNILMVINDNINFPGGKVEIGETIETALIRETIEETNILILDSTLLFHKTFLLNNEYWDGYFFLVTKYKNKPINNEPEKFTKVEFKNKNWIIENTNSQFVLDALDLLGKTKKFSY